MRVFRHNPPRDTAAQVLFYHVDPSRAGRPDEFEIADVKRKRKFLARTRATVALTDLFIGAKVTM